MRSCRRAIQNNGRLIVIEDIVGPCNEGLEGKIMDLNMMVITGGVERTREEYAAILQAAAFRLARVVPTHMMISISKRTLFLSLWPTCSHAAPLHCQYLKRELAHTSLPLRRGSGPHLREPYAGDEICPAEGVASPEATATTDSKILRARLIAGGPYLGMCTTSVRGG